MLEAAEILAKEGITCDVLNLRSIRPLDRQAIVQSVKKTNRIVSCEVGMPQSGVGAEIAGVLMECKILNLLTPANFSLASAFDYLDAPLERITGLDVPMPYSEGIESKCTPTAANIVRGVKKVLTGVRL